MKLTVLATADIHSPRYIGLLSSALLKVTFRECDLLVIAGDIVDHGRVSCASQVFRLLRRYYKGPIIAVFGNEDYENIEDMLRKSYPDVVWLNDDYCDVKVKDVKLRIIGTRGVLDRPTSWQRRNIPRVYEMYARRVKRLETLFRDSSYPVIFVSHYAPTYETLRGEVREIWPYLGSKKLEALIRRYRPLVVIHGHAHKSVVEKSVIQGVPIYNVSLPAFHKVFRISLTIRPSLLEYFN